MRLTVENTSEDPKGQHVVASGVNYRVFPGEKLDTDFTTAEVDEARKNPALRFNDDQLKVAGYHDTDARKIDEPKPTPAHGTRSRKPKTGAYADKR